MSRRLCQGSVFAVVCLVVASCSRPADAPALTELQRAKAGDLEVVLLAKGDALKTGRDEAVVEFRSVADRRLVDVGTVTVNASMPMAGMGPMLGTATAKPADVAGRYSVETDLGMAGTWRLGVEWNGPAGRGSVNLPGTVR